MNPFRIAIYPGSFNPFHAGHLEVANKASEIADLVIVAPGTNPLKAVKKDLTLLNQRLRLGSFETGLVPYEIWEFEGLLKELVHDVELYFEDEKKDQKVSLFIVKGLRNAQDLEEETAQQYWGEDLGIKIPTLYVITSRDKRHISSSAIRMVQAFKEERP